MRQLRCGGGGDKWVVVFDESPLHVSIVDVGIGSGNRSGGGCGGDGDHRAYARPHATSA